MGDNFKLDVNIPQKKIEEMAKQVIREIIESKIQQTLENINIEKVINDKINTFDTKLPKIVKKAIDEKIENMKCEAQYNIKGIIREAVLEEIQKKPLSGNIYLKIDNENIETDYDDSW